MKKILSVILIAVMLLGCTVLVSFAGNGPYQNKGGDDLDLALISFMDLSSGEISYLYNPVSNENKLQNTSSLSYDVKTNTLSLKNFKTDDVMVLTAMGDDFKIKLSGYNELGCIIADCLTWGNSITVTGKGVLVVNKNKQLSDAIYIDANITGNAFFKVEKTVGVKLYNGASNESTIGVYGVAESDAEKTIILEGNVTENPAIRVSENYVKNIYEQERVKLVDHYEGTGAFCMKKGEGNENKIFLAEVVDEENGIYDVAEVVYDNELKNYLVLPVADGFYGIMLEQSGFDFLPEDKYPTDADVLCIDFYETDMDVCIDENGKRCVFIDYSDIKNPETDIEVYGILEHTKYGKLALLNSPQKAYKELKKLQSVTRYNHINKTSVITINETPEKIPAKVALKSAANAYGGVKVTWNSVSAASDYTVYRATKKNGSWSGWSILGTVTSTEFFDTTAKNGVEYKYTVRAGNILGLGGFDKNGVTVKYVLSPKATASNTATGIKLAWGKTDGASKYTVYRSQYSNGKWSGWKTLGDVKTLSYADKSVVSGGVYRYTVRAVNGKVKSAFTNSNEIIFLSVPAVKISALKDGVKATWSKVNGAKAYTVYRSEAVNGKWSSWKVVAKDVTTTSFSDKTAVSGKTYKYTARAVAGNSTGAFKESASLLFLAQPTVKIANASNGIKVSWTKSAGAKGYTIYRSQYSGGKWSSWKTMGTAAATKTSWTDKSVKSGVQYRYTVRAVNGSLKSTYTATAGLVFLSPPTVKASIGSYKVNVTWSKVAGATEYKLYRADFKDGKWTSWALITTLKADTTTYVDKTIAVDSVYKYAVKPIRGASIGAYATDEVWYCYAPSISIVNTDTGVMVNWESFKGAEQYILYRSEEKNGKWTEWKKVKTVKPNKEYWIDETVVAGVKYKYAIKAQRGDDKTPTGVSNERVYIKTRYEF